MSNTQHLSQHHNCTYPLPKRVRRLLDALADAVSQQDRQAIGTLASSAKNPNLIESILLLYGARAFSTNAAKLVDTARMAAAAGRNVNLTWSERRWQEEHDRLARYETLRKLSADNVAYAVPDWAQALLKRDWPGYRIASRRRLAMEGLRQRHCIASWDRLCQRGSSVVVTVFLEGKRWTVDVVRPGYAGAMHTRFNRRATAEVRTQIIDMLGIEERPSPVVGGRQDDELSHDERLAQFLHDFGTDLRARGAVEIEVYFDGYGDSGSIETVSAEDVNGEPIALTNEEQQAIEELCTCSLSAEGIDWYNDDGGYGTMTVPLADEPPRADFDVSVRFTDTDSRDFSVELDDEMVS